MAPVKTRILVVDDEADYRVMISRVLETNGYETLIAEDGEQAVIMASGEHPAVIIMDVRMPVMDGFEACRRIRGFSTVPVIMLTARSEDASKIRGLDVGADDYITKPFNSGELLARVRAALRRVDLDQAAGDSPILQVGPLRINVGQRRVFLNDREVLVGEVEYKVLYELMRRPGQMVTSEELAYLVWGADVPEMGALRQVVFRLRQKIEPDAKNPTFLQSRLKRGYLFTSPEDINEEGSGPDAIE